MKRVVVLDYGSGNLRSAERALARAGAEVTLTTDLAVAARADGLVVPGVGAYAACMAGLEAVGAGRVIVDRVTAGAPVLGICVGLQVLFDAGEEHGVVTKGLGLVPGTVARLAAPVVPHMGWNTVVWPEASVLGAGLDPATRFYFVHSYAARPAAARARTGIRVAVSEHGEPFIAAVEHGALAATQFHPEKSGNAGATLLTNWIGML
ncbi:MAG: imidazole glycerol phosphate synthase subunit HisH [Dactylosporangium sp.]|nr:imidazole glycerol phosphate synthase subunit HisH [Dactylosporangium sp.]NNJ59707.1 imidazole glycerol phosphate synthase subunit HisH [Dactylosporangium sp.]